MTKEEIALDTTWDFVKDLSLPNQVRTLCDCIDEIREDLPDRSKRIDKEKPPKS